MNVPVGTLINMTTVLFGTVLGVAIGNRLPERLRETAMAVIGLVTLVLGVQMAGSTRNILVTLSSVLIGGLLGEGWRIDVALEQFGRKGEALVSRRADGGAPFAGAPSKAQHAAHDAAAHHPPVASAPHSASIATAFVTASLIFCVGPITILGSIQDGLTGDYQLIAIKSLLDLIASLTLASTLGWGVGLSTLTILVVQGGMTLGVQLLGANATGLISGRTIVAGGTALPLGSTMLDEMTAAGGVVMLGIGLLLLDLKRIRVANLVPAIAIAPALVLVLYSIGVPLTP